MIINSTYTVYKRGTKPKNNQRKQSMPSSDRYIHFFLFFFFFFLHMDSLDIHNKHHPIKYQLKDIWPESAMPFQLNSENIFF